LGIDGASHVDLYYDKDEYVPTAIAKLADFFTTNLIGAKPEARMRSYNSATSLKVRRSPLFFISTFALLGPV
jgi:hypothetical protein